VVPGYASGTTFSLYRSESGTTWVPVTPDATCTLDSVGTCTFRTDHLSYFATVFDSTPDAFSFTAQTDKELATSYESNAITVAGINATSPISIVGGEYKIGAGAYTSATGTVVNGETVTVRLTSAGSYSTATSATLSIGGVSGTFSITTKASSGGGSGGGGGGGGGGGMSQPLTVDNCPNGDKTNSYYDGKCTLTTSTGSTSTGTVSHPTTPTQDYTPTDDS